MSYTDSSDAQTPPSDSKPAELPQAAGHDQRPSQQIRPERGRLSLALLISLLIHTLLLGLTFGGQGFGLPGFGFPWQERRVEVPELRVVLVPGPATAAEAASTSIAEAAATPILEAAATPIAKQVATPVAQTLAPASVEPPVDVGPALVPSADLAPIPEPALIAAAPTAEAPWVVPSNPAQPTPVVAAASGASSPETAAPPLPAAGHAAPPSEDQGARERALELTRLDRAKQEAQRAAEQLEAARQESARLEASRAEAARHEAIRQESVRQEAARLEAARAEGLRQEAARQDALKLEALRQDALKQEAVRQESARAEAARVEAARLQAERQEATRQEAARQEAARQEAARVEAAQAAAARREATLRAIGRQLDEEADRRDAAAAAARQPSAPTAAPSGVRRGRLFGRTDPNAELILYAEAWGRKIQLNMTFDMVREAAKQAHTDPLVTVAIRSNGSVESVSFVRSSGVTAIDEAIRRIVDSQAPYPAFPPGLAREFDVIEIRRTWHFDMAIRLY